MTVKDAVAMVTTAQSTLIEQADMFTGICSFIVSFTSIFVALFFMLLLNVGLPCCSLVNHNTGLVFKLITWSFFKVRTNHILKNNNTLLWPILLTKLYILLSMN